MKKVIIITGPTAVGKTAISLEIASQLKTEIISGDAYQIYKEFNIANAKPTNKELSQIKHHLISEISIFEDYSAYEYQQRVRSIINKEFINTIPLIVGGSGLYIDSVIKDYRFSHNLARNEAQYEKFSNIELYEILSNLDYDLAQAIHPNNRKRVIRAIELSKSDISKENRFLNKKHYYDALIIFLSMERSILYERINQRVDQMMALGLLEEARYAYNHLSQLSKTAAATIGIKEFFPYFQDEISIEHAIENVKKASRNYAKRQITWFRNKCNVVIIEMHPDEKNNLQNIINLINQHRN